MKLVMVGGHTRNIGKTSVVAGLIRALPEMRWTAVKITQFGHGVCSVNGAACDCAVTEHQFSITEEREKDSGTDTARFLAAGARRSLWVRTKQGELFTALEPFKQKIASDAFVIVESNSLRRFIKPTLYLQVIDPTNADFKASAQQFFDLADAYLFVTQPDNDDAIIQQQIAQNVLLARERQKNKPCFAVALATGFVTQAVIDFVKASLTSETVKAS
jgi:molybdopterin-guanine dinucleotide biosynthesis protein